MKLPDSSAFRVALGLLVLLGIPILLMLPNAVYWSNNGDLRFTFKWFFLPTLAASYWLLTRKRVRDRTSAWERLLGAPALAALAVVVINSQVLFVNAKVSPQVDVVLEGTVTDKSSPSSKSNARIVFVDEQGVRHRWPVHRNVYEKAEVGDSFRINARRGGLGILYVHSADRYWELSQKVRETKP